MENKTHWKKLTNPEYLGACHLVPGSDSVVTIEKVVREMVTGTGGKKEECTVAYLTNVTPNKMILNNTNCKTIAKMYDSYIEGWAGESISIYIAKIRAFGEEGVECLRIREKKPERKKPELTPQHKRWAGARKAISEGNATIDQIKKNFTITNENEKLLCSK